MLQFDEIRLELEGLEPELKDLSEALGLKAMANEAAELDMKASEPGFWDDAQRSQKVLQRSSYLKNKIAAYEKLQSTYEDALALVDLANEENDLSLLPEAQGIYSAYLAAHAASAAAPLIARHDTESLQLVLKLADEESRRQIALACSQSGWSEGAALTLGGQRPRRQKTYDFDDL